MARRIQTVLGIDTGFRHIGYALMSIDELNVVTLDKYGYWDLQAEHKSMNLRSFKGMLLLKDKLIKLDQENSFDAICLETVPHTRFNGRDATLASTNMFRAYAIFNDKRYSELHAATIKKGITGSGRGDKTLIKEKIIELFPEVPEDLRFDVYDAIAASYIAIHRELDFWWFTE